MGISIDAQALPNLHLNMQLVGLDPNTEMCLEIRVELRRLRYMYWLETPVRHVAHYRHLHRDYLLEGSH